MTNTKISSTSKSGAGQSKPTLYEQKWTGRPILHKFENGIVFQIPPEFKQFWISGVWTEAPQNLSTLKSQKTFGFKFFLPGYSGYTLENWESDQYGENLVDVQSIEYVGLGQEKPGAPGRFPPNQLKRILSSGATSSAATEIMFGLNCLKVSVSSETNSRICHGVKNDDTKEIILLEIMLPPYADWVQFPYVQARYFSPKYGGIEISWRTHMKNLHSWKEIDSFIWKGLDLWAIHNNK